jgi:hypothetical protein
VREAVADSARRNSGRAADVTAFGNANRAYRNYSVLRDAASHVGADEGVFSAAQLHSAVRAADQSAGKGAFARGAAPMQQLSDDARSVMSRRVADSGTPERALIASALLTPSALLAPQMTLGAVAPAALLAGMYTRPGSAAARAFMVGRTGRTRQTLRRILEELTERGAAGIGGPAHDALTGD